MVDVYSIDTAESAWQKYIAETAKNTGKKVFTSKEHDIFIKKFNKTHKKHKKNT